MSEIKTYTKLYKKDETGKIRYWYMQQMDGGYRSVAGILGREDSSQQVSNWSIAEPKNLGKVNETTSTEQAALIIMSTYRIRQEQGYAETVEASGKKFFQPMLAAKYFALNQKKRDDLFKDHVYIQPKLDGQRCIVTAEGMFSRHGKEIISAPHIYESLKPVFAKYPDLILDGELYNHDLNDDFNKLMSLVRKSKPTEEDPKESKEKIQYWIYDLPSCNENFHTRNWELTRLFIDEARYFNKHCVCVETHLVTSDEEVQHRLEEYLDHGFEGAIVRLNKPYENKRTNSLLKVKKFEDGEFPILAIEEGRGNLAGKAGRIIVDFNGKAVSSGLKFSHDEAKRIWDQRERLIGKLATVRYFNVTEDGSLRFPKCVDIGREDWE